MGVLVGVLGRGTLGVLVGVRVAVGGTDVAVLVAIEGSIVSVADAGVVFVMPFPVLNAPAGMVLIRLPGVLEVTSIATVQEP